MNISTVSFADSFLREDHYNTMPSSLSVDVPVTYIIQSLWLETVTQLYGLYTL